MPQEYVDNDTVSQADGADGLGKGSTVEHELTRFGSLSSYQFLTRLTSAFKGAGEPDSRAGSVWMTHKRCQYLARHDRT